MKGITRCKKITKVTYIHQYLNTKFTHQVISFIKLNGKAYKGHGASLECVCGFEEIVDDRIDTRRTNGLEWDR